MGGGIHGGFGATKGARDVAKGKQRFNSEEAGLIKELERNHKKFTKEDIVFITRDQTGQVVWLEKGNKKAGLKHILDYGNNGNGHAGDFKKSLGVDRKDIPSGTILSTSVIEKGHIKKIKRVYEYNDSFVVLYGIGENGFIVSAYPINKDKL